MVRQQEIEWQGASLPGVDDAFMMGKVHNLTGAAHVTTLRAQFRPETITYRHANNSGKTQLAEYR